MNIELQNAIALLTDNNFKVAEKLMPLPIGYCFKETTNEVGYALCIDCETTGKSDLDEAIEVGLILVSYDKTTLDLCQVVDAYNGFNEPSIEISDEAKNVHGISFEEVKGHQFDIDKVNKLIDAADFCFAHHSEFDRKMLEKNFPALTEKKFGCSLKDVEWEINSNKLDYILFHLGYWFDGHRAVNDCEATLMALSKWNSHGQSYFSDIVKALENVEITVYATKSPFESKDKLKGKSYWWDGDNKVWYKKIESDALVDELTYMAEHIYDKNDIKASVVVTTKGAKERFSHRSGIEEVIYLYE